MSTQNSSHAAVARRLSATRHTARVLRVLLLLVCGLALFASPAAAQDDDVQVDPDSPSGREYALPVDSARSQASKGSSTRRSAGQAAPLFGEGVRSGAGGGGAGDSAQADKTASKAGPSDDAGEDEDASSALRRAATSTPQTLRAQAAAPDGGSSLLVIVGVGAGVLLAGGLIGLALRRRTLR